jgi:hypothetical protein
MEVLFGELMIDETALPRSNSALTQLCMIFNVGAVLPDGILSNQKYQFG